MNLTNDCHLINFSNTSSYRLRLNKSELIKSQKYVHYIKIFWSRDGYIYI